MARDGLYPCKDCIKRHHLCWDECEDYKAAKSVAENEKHARSQYIIEVSAGWVHGNIRRRKRH